MRALNIEELRRLAYRRLPAALWAYVENGAYEEETLRRNRSALESLALVPRVLNDVSQRRTATNLAGQPSSIPVALAPVGACGILWPNGEVESARAAESHGIPFCLSTLSIATIEDVAEATHQPFWFQLYPMKDKSISEALIQRAVDAGCSALILSMDVHVRSRRHPEKSRGLSASPGLGLLAWDALAHPSWLLSLVRSRRKTFGNLIGLVEGAKNVPRTMKWLESQFDPSLRAETIDWVRGLWPGKVLVKGIMHREDARIALDHGADGIVVSNHGGRQADGVVSAVQVLPGIVEAVKGRGEVLADGGIRSGIDVLKMLALGADGCMIGRAFVYGLAAAGGEGVLRAIELVRGELDENMALCGICDVSSLPVDLIQRMEQCPDRTHFVEEGERFRLY